nr:hypothetical protein [uncultured Acetatifactor sp.]
MKKRNILAAVKAMAYAMTAALILTASVGSAWSYFTTYTSASGSHAIDLGNETRVVERFSDSTKRLTITNDSLQPVYVRATAFSGSGYPLSYSDASGLWVDGGDGYHYYSQSLPARQETAEGTVASQTSELEVRITFPVDEEVEDGDGFNVVVVYESVPVRYDGDGNELKPWEIDWTEELKSGPVEGGA